MMAASIPWDTLGVSLVWAYEGKPYSQRRTYCDDALYLTSWLVLDGAAAVYHDGREIVARKGEWLFPRPVPRYQEFMPDTSLLSLSLRVVWPEGRPLFDEGLSLVLSAAHHEELTCQARALPRLKARAGTLSGYLAFQKALYGWAEQVCETLIAAGVPLQLFAQGDTRRAELLHLLETCPLDEMHPGQALAKRLGVSQVQLERLCMAMVGRTSRQYLEARRLEYARLVLSYKLTKEVAAELGFRHVSTFSAWYKRKMGHSPTLRP